MKKEKKISKILAVIKNIISWTILVVVVILMSTILFSRISGNTPSIMGYSIFRVSTGSMEPELNVGEVILVKECNVDDLKKGDIVTYKGTKGSMAGKIVTHRVVEPAYENEGKTYITTCGDANELNDPPVEAENVMGKMEREMPIFTKCFNFFLTPGGLLIVIVLIILAFLGDIMNIVNALTKSSINKKQRSMQDIIDEIKLQEKENSENTEKITDDMVDQIIDEIKDKRMEENF